MDEDDFEPSDLGFDPYAGTYVDDDPVDPWEWGWEDNLIGGDSDLMGEH